MVICWKTFMFMFCEQIYSIWPFIHSFFVLSKWINDGLSRSNVWMATKDKFFLTLKTETKSENHDVSRNGHRSKRTQPNLITLVSFFELQNTENPPLRSFWGKPSVFFFSGRFNMLVYRKGVFYNEIKFWFSRLLVWNFVKNFSTSTSFSLETLINLI